MNIKYKIIIISVPASLLCLFGMINNKVPSHGQSPPQLLLELVNALWGQILAVILYTCSSTLEIIRLSLKCDDL